jgi:hypothetical protein
MNTCQFLSLGDPIERPGMLRQPLDGHVFNLTVAKDVRFQLVLRSFFFDAWT